jgi:hypothetical protein
MQIVKWTEHVQDRPQWKVIVEKAKTLRVVVHKKKKKKMFGTVRKIGSAPNMS